MSQWWLPESPDTPSVAGAKRLLILAADQREHSTKYRNSSMAFCFGVIY